MIGFFIMFFNRFFGFFEGEGGAKENLCWFFRPKQGGLVVVTGYNDLMRNSHGLALIFLMLVRNGEPFCIAAVVHIGIYLIV